MAKIKSYTYTVRPVEACADWDPKSKTMTPMSFTEEDNRDLYEALNNISLAAEAGVLDSYLWPQQLFANKASFDNFLDMLSEYEETYRITDQWYTALGALIGDGDNGGGFVTGSEIADVLLNTAIDEGMLANFGRKKPKYKYSVAQCKEAWLESAKDRGSEYTYFQDKSRDDVWKSKEISEFGKHFDLKISDEEYRKAADDGKAYLAAKKVASKKAPAKKVAVKKVVTKEVVAQKGK
jgi:hypothetical protein